MTYLSLICQALEFITRDYEPQYYYWELLEAWKKLCLVGFFSIILTGQIEQLFIAFLCSLFYLLLISITSPYRSIADDVVAKVCNSGLVAVFFFALALKIGSLTDVIDIYLTNQLRTLFTYNVLFASVGTTAACAVALAITMAFAAQEVINAAQRPILQLHSTSGPPVLSIQHNMHWHLFLSHIWGSGQDQCATIKRQLSLLLPDVSIFLDIDDLESIDKLEEYIEGSQVIMIFVSKGYFKSNNCLREVRCAVAKKKPLTLVHDTATYLQSFSPLGIIKNEECPDDLRPIFDCKEVIEWHRIKDFQLVGLKLLAEEVLLGCPNIYNRLLASGRLTSSPQHPLYNDIFVPGELTNQKLGFIRPVSLYSSSSNPGASMAAEVIVSAIEGLGLSAKPPPEATHFLLYLAHETWVGEAGERLAEEVRQMMSLSLPIVMLHENDMANGGCEFSRFFETTPSHLIHDGLYNALALAYYPGHCRLTSLYLVAKALGAKPLRASKFNLEHSCSSSTEAAKVVRVQQLSRRRSLFRGSRSDRSHGDAVASQRFESSAVTTESEGETDLVV